MPVHPSVPTFVTERILRFRYLILAAVAVASGVVAGGRGDWDQFADAGRAMLGTDGLHVFVRRLDTQTGPVALLIVRAFAVTPRNGFVLCTVVCGVLGLWSIRLVELIAIQGSRHGDGRRVRTSVTTLLGGVLLLFGWGKLGGYGHLDDALVLAAAVASVRLVRSDRHLGAAILLGVSLAIKPWAVLFLPLTLLVRPHESHSTMDHLWLRWRPTLVALGIGAALWSPFIVAAPHTVRSIRPTVRVASDSVLRLFGIDDASLPNWMRVAQLLLALAVGLLAIYRERVMGLIVAVVGVRIVTDPGTWAYYTPGFVLGALVWDAAVRRRLVPLATIVGTLLLAPTWVVPSDDLRAVMRLVAGIAAVVAVFAVSEPAPSADPSCPSSDPSAVD